jgi:hypothetical protein
MADKLKLNHGPWSEIFLGTWSGYEVHLFENPEKFTLTIIYEKARGKTKGMAILLNKYFMVGGDTSRLLKTLGGYALVFEKNYPSFKRRYLSLSSGPRYIDMEKELPSTAVDEAFKKIEEMSERAVELSHGLGVELTELKNAKEDEISSLFSEPILLPGIVMREGGRAPAAAVPAVKRPGAMLVLGKKITGGNAQVSIDELATTVIIGPIESRKKAVQVLMESCVLNGVSVIIFDEDGSFEKMGAPNRDFEYEAYPDLQPIGMPLKTTDLTVDLNLIDAEMFKEIIGMSPEKESLGKTAMELISRVLKESQGSLESLSDMEEKLLTLEEEVKRFHVYRAVRMVKVCDNAYAGVFAGKIEMHRFISPYAKSMGSISRVDVSNIPQNLKKAFAFSLIKSLYEQLRESTPELRIVVFFVRGVDIAPSAVKKRLDEALLKTLQECSQFGVGYCLGVQHGIDLNPQILESSSLRFDFITNEEAAVKEANQRAYRMKLRPTLSA